MSILWQAVYSYAEGLQWCLEMARGLDCLHTSSPRIMHRDMKLENVLLEGARFKRVHWIRDAASLYCRADSNAMLGEELEYKSFLSCTGGAQHFGSQNDQAFAFAMYSIHHHCLSTRVMMRECVAVSFFRG